MAIRKLFSSRPKAEVHDDPPRELKKEDTIPTVDPSMIPVEEPEVPTYMLAARERMELRRTAEVARQNPPAVFTDPARPGKRQRVGRRPRNTPREKRNDN